MYINWQEDHLAQIVLNGWKIMKLMILISFKQFLGIVNLADLWGARNLCFPALIC